MLIDKKFTKVDTPDEQVLYIAISYIVHDVDLDLDLDLVPSRSGRAWTTGLRTFAVLAVNMRQVKRTRKPARIIRARWPRKNCRWSKNSDEGGISVCSVPVPPTHASACKRAGRW